MDKLYYYKKFEKTNHPDKIHKDLIIYGATPAGITTAIQAKSYGMEVAIIEFSGHIGGITSNGLGATDLGAKEAMGGLVREFYRRIGSYYNREEQWTFEPKVAQKIFLDWVEEHKIPVYYRQHLQGVTVKNRKIKKITMENGNQFSAKYFVDASYEADLMSKAGVSYTVGRESNGTYNETYNGVQFGHPHHRFEKMVDPYKIPRDKSSGLIQGINEILSEREQQGQGDKRIQAYNFRICLTKDKEKRVPFPNPKDYKPERYELLLRYIQAGNWDAMNLHTKLPSGKTDLNNYGAVSTDYIGMNYGWPDGTYTEREQIFQDHLNYNLGMLYFLVNDKRVPVYVRDEVREWGLPKDEFPATGHWPAQLYIRESRRMLSDYVMTDRNCLGKEKVEDSIGLASYQMDSHHVRRVLINGEVINEGDVEIPISPYPISYRSIRPKEEECINLLVPVCLSSSHIAFGSIRMEPVFMLLGQAAGIAVSIAFQNHWNIQDVPYEELKKELVKAGQVIKWDETIHDNPKERMKATFGKE